MTVENTRNKKRFFGDGVTDTVTFSFRVLASTDIRIYVYPEDLEFDDLEDYLVDPGDYTVTLDEDGEGGEVVFDPGAIPANDEIGLIYNLLDLTQTADLPTEGNFNEEAVETALDRVVLQNIQQQERINRNLALRDEDPLVDDDFEGFFVEAVQPEDRADRIAIFNENGDGIKAGVLAADLEDIAAIIPEIQVVAGIADKVETVANSQANVNIVAAAITNVNTVAVNIADVNTVAGISVAVQDVAAIDTQIVALYGISAEMLALYAIIADISAVADIDSDVETVAANISDINTVVANIVDIQNAEENALLAKDWATKAEDSIVSGGLYSAYHWAQKAQDYVGFAAGNEGIVTANTGTNYAINFATERNFDLTLTGNCTFTFTNPPANCGGFTLVLRQDGTGSRTVTWPASVDWPNGVAPTIPSAASSKSVFVFMTPDGGTTWLGFLCGASLS